MINSRKRVEKNPPAETQRSERLPSASRTSNGTSSWPPNLGNPPPTAEPLRDWSNGVVQNQPLKLPRSLESQVGSSTVSFIWSFQASSLSNLWPRYTSCDNLTGRHGESSLKHTACQGPRYILGYFLQLSVRNVHRSMAKNMHKTSQKFHHIQTYQLSQTSPVYLCTSLSLSGVTAVPWGLSKSK
jgi:hypothetical protein